MATKEHTIRNMRVISDDGELLHLNCHMPIALGAVEEIDGKKYKVIDNTK